MKPSVSKYIRQRLMIIKINLVNTWQSEVAYFGEAWGNVLSVIAFTLTYIVFVSVIYANVQTVAGYTRDEMLFLLLLRQAGYYILMSCSYKSVARMIMDVNRGSLDLMLAKPLPALFYVSTRNLSILTVLRQGIPSLFFLMLAINWHNISVTPIHLLSGLIIFFVGQLAMNGFLYLLGMPVFWFGQSADLLALGYNFTGLDLPYEGVPAGIRSFLTIGIPALISAALAASVMLGKSSALIGVIIAVAVAILFMALKSFVWKRALLNYSSASS